MASSTNSQLSTHDRFSGTHKPAPPATPRCSGWSPGRRGPSRSPPTCTQQGEPGDRSPPAEEQVAELVSRGLTNRAIAKALVVSERTAQNHVQHILTKLGFTTRSQIAAWVVSRRQANR